MCSRVSEMRIAAGRRIVMFNLAKTEKGMFSEHLGDRSKRGLRKRLEVLKSNVHSQSSQPVTDNLRKSKVFNGLWRIAA